MLERRRAKKVNQYGFGFVEWPGSCPEEKEDGLIGPLAEGRMRSVVRYSVGFFGSERNASFV